MAMLRRPKIDALEIHLENDGKTTQAADIALSITEEKPNGQISKTEKGELGAEKQRPDGEPESEVEGFVESQYLAAFPDIANAVAVGKLVSGLNHYLRHGVKESRLKDLRYLNAGQTEDTATFPRSDIDTIFTAQSGWCLVVGWINDGEAVLNESFCLKGDKIVAAVCYHGRCRREDAEKAVATRPGQLLGFWTFFQVAGGLAPTDVIKIRLIAGCEQKTFTIQPKHVGDESLLVIALEYLASARYFTNPQAESAVQLKGGLGETLVNFNAGMSRQVVGGAYVRRFGKQVGKLDGSIIVCLYGRSEYLFLQASLFTGCPAADRYEFIYVSNSPELAETLLKEAAIAHRIYNMLITIVILPRNVGFGAANNVAVKHARSQRILIVNPDVFPRDRNWAVTHSAIVADRPSEQTAIFGAPLYYDDGSLMHAGMFFEVDTNVSIRGGKVEQHDMIRVEHYAKGAPPNIERFLTSRKVPAVTGAFMSLERAWFESLGGFSLEYVFGHYEDADLCLKSLTGGKPVWVHPVPFWHLEGKGSTRRHVHEGGSTVNRWYFTERWKEYILGNLNGRAPSLLETP